MITHSSILAWRTTWIEEPGRLQSNGLQNVGHNYATNVFTFSSKGSASGKNIRCQTFALTVLSCCCSVAQSCLTLCDPMDCSTPGFSVLHHLLELAKTHVHRVGDVIQSSHPLFFPFSSCLQSFLAPGRVFSNESAHHIRWPKYWSFSFSISLSNEHSGLISCQIDWFDLLVVQGTLKTLLQHHSSKA